MNKILKLLSLTVLLAIAVTSCDLNRYPYDEIEQTQAFKTMTDAASLRNGMYSQLQNRVGGKYQFSGDVQCDQLNATLDFGNRNGAPHTWTAFYANDYTIQDVWKDSYNCLANINNFLENVGLIETEDDDDVATLNVYTGEAYLFRAYYYHRLVSLWAKDYEPSTASTDLGVPLILIYDVDLKPARATVQEVYDQIVSDINSAKTLLAGVAGVKCSTRFTLDCAYALEARVLLDMHDYTGAAAAADHVINAGTYPLIDNETDLATMWTNDNSTEVICQLAASAADLPDNPNNIYLRYDPNDGYYKPDFVPAQWVVDMFDVADIRRNVYFAQETIWIMGAEYTNIYLVNKYPGNPELFTGATSNYQHKPKIFRVAELYLISAEAKAQSTSTEGAALTTLNALRMKRGLSELTGVTGTALMDEIMEERTRELIFEGFRLSDLKRWDLGFTRHNAQNDSFILTTPSDDYYQKSVAAGADKFVWGIPSNDITTNPNIADQQNPGW